MLARNSVKVEIVGPHGKRSGRTGKYESAKRSVVRYTETFFSILHPGTYVLRLSIRGACEGRVTRVPVVALPTE